MMLNEPDQDCIEAADALERLAAEKAQAEEKAKGYAALQLEEELRADALEARLQEAEAHIRELRRSVISPASDCAFCDLGTPLHEYPEGHFYHVTVRGQMVRCYGNRAIPTAGERSCVGCCVIPQEKVLAIIAALERLAAEKATPHNARLSAIEECARELETHYPGHAWLNAACAAIRALSVSPTDTRNAAMTQPPSKLQATKLSPVMGKH